MNDYIEEFKKSIALGKLTPELIELLTYDLEGEESAFHTNPSEWIENSINTIWEKIKTSKPEVVEENIENAISTLSPAYAGMQKSLFECIMGEPRCLAWNFNQPISMSKDEFLKRHEYYGYEIENTYALVDSFVPLVEDAVDFLSVHVYELDNENVFHFTKNIKVLNYRESHRYLVTPSVDDYK